MTHFRDNGLSRASFDLQCPAEKLTMTPLNDGAKATMDTFPGSLVGVSGCGKQVVYVLSGGTWIMNSAGDKK
jgi:hypothetical protein